MLAIAPRVLLLATALVVSGCAACSPRDRDAWGQRGGEPVVVSGRPG